ncbi:MAG: hypothetical protein ABIO70_28105 [Pseudomonadota bacterium]
MGEDQGQAGKRVEPQRDVEGWHVHPRACAFMREVADARRVRRMIMAELDPSSPVFQVMTGTGRPERDGMSRAWKSLPGESEEGPEPPAPWISERTRDAAESLWGLGARMGLNSLHAWELMYSGGVIDARKYGIDGSSLDDAGRLGARVVRQHGQRDLLWAMMAPSSRITSTADLAAGELVPLEGNLSTVMAQGLTDSGVRLANVELLKDALQKARDNGVKMVFTFLSLGGGGAGTSQTPPPEGDTDYDHDAVDYWASTVSPGSTIGTGGGYGSFDRLPWAGNHESHPSDTAVGGGTIMFPATSATASNPWFLDALDPACPYKRFYLGMIAETAAGLLKDAETAIRDEGQDFSLSDAVEAIEIFNEEDAMDAWKDPSGARDRLASGEMWGRAFLHAALAFRQTLDCEDIKIWMPGIASFKVTPPSLAFTWEDKLKYVDGFIQGIWLEANRFYSELGFSDLQTLTDLLPTLVQGCDLHWYHGIDTSDPLRHIGHLVIEVGELRDAIISSMTLRWSLEEPPTDFPITVFENGWKQGGDYPASLAASRAEEFQAWEVWRRLGGALAGGAVVAGWHPWMAAASAYYDMGLRVDDNAGDEPARTAAQRPAWFAYAVLAAVLGDRIRWGRMVLPSVTARHELAALVVREPEVAGIVVLEYRLTPLLATAGSATWAYLVLWDPSVPLSVSVSSILVATPVGVGAALSGIQEYGFSNTVDFQTTGDDEHLPVDEVTPVATRLPVAPFSVVPRMEPRLFVSPRRIEWQIGKGSGGGGGALHSRPDWLDDPGVPLPAGAGGDRQKTSG